MNSPAQFKYEMRYFKFWLNFTFRPEAKVKREDMILGGRRAVFGGNRPDLKGITSNLMRCA
jgi:hypothetical protein